jgi:ribonuclease P protein component
MSAQTFSFSRRYRLTNPAEFKRVFANASRSRDRYFTLLYCDNAGASARLGFAVAKKKISTAVGRNRLRRLARESFRLQRQTLGSVDIIILAQPAAASATNSQLFASLEKHWQRLLTEAGGDLAKRQRQSRD